MPFYVRLQDALLSGTLLTLTIIHTSPTQFNLEVEVLIWIQPKLNPDIPALTSGSASECFAGDRLGRFLAGICHCENTV